MMDQILTHPLVSNPLFLRTLGEELRIFGIHEELQKQITYYLKSETIDDLFERVLGNALKKIAEGEQSGARSQPFGRAEGINRERNFRYCAPTTSNLGAYPKLARRNFAR